MCCPPPSQPEETAPPNILLIFVDDLGIDQLSLYDDENYYSELYPYAYTPNINSLAEEGVTFTQARANPVCSPSRAALQSGMYSFANGVGDLVFGPNQGVDCVSIGFKDFLPTATTINATPLADVVRQRPGFEYYSALIGKGHLGIDSVQEPLNPWCGLGDPNCLLSSYGWHHVTQALHYDEFRGVLRGLSQHPNPESHLTDPDCTGRADNYFTHFYWIEDKLSGVPPAERLVIEGTYYSAYEAEKVVLTMENAPEPYLLVWCTIDPHLPAEWPPQEDHGFGDDPNPTKIRGAYVNTTFRAKLEYLDSMIGVVLDSLTPAERDNLTIFLMGDNGTQRTVMLTSAGEESYPDCHPLIDDWKAAGGPEFVSTDPYNPSRLKGQVFEGGIRVPLIVNGPPVATSMEGQVSDQLVDVVDLHETIREVSYIGGVYPGPLGFNDSQSFAWVLRGDPGPWGGLPKRDFSYSATFSPNTDFFTPSGDWMGETAREYWKDCVIRQNSTTAKWYKMIRTVAYDSGGTATVGHLLHELHFGSGIDPESCVLPSGHAEYIPMKNKLESVTGIRDIDF